MAKIKVRPRTGALSELLKKKGMTQMDAFEQTRVDRKTLLKIERGEEVKLETLQQVATKLQVTEGYFLHPPVAAEGTVDSDLPLEPGTILLRKLDAARLADLLKGSEDLRWQLKAQVRDDAVRTFLVEFEQAMEKFRKHIAWNQPEVWDGDPSLRFQLDLLKTADDIAARLERLADHGIALLGADYLFWECSSEDGEYEYHRWTTVNYKSSRTVLLSVEPAGTQSRRAHVSQGSLPPTCAPPETRGRTTTVLVNGLELPTLVEVDGELVVDKD
jgi:transcriptional regulator with XRE-family HTH domain